ncbi:MAG TPA: NUDIX hydrolase [Candidatus Aquicultor sp.]|jgi:ADP-ribose pyrophosphatase
MGDSFSVLQSKLIYEGYIISLYVDTVQTPTGQEYEREVVRHLDAVGVVALTDQQEVVLVRQYRHPIEDMLLEIPAGLLKELENPVECAIRELKEETGYTAKRIEKLAEFYTSAGFTNEKFYLYFSDDIEVGEHEREPGEEGMELEVIPLKDALSMVAQGEISDAKTLTAILMAAQRVGSIAQ